MTSRTATRVALASLRRWWLEAAVTGLCGSFVLIGFAQGGGQQIAQMVTLAVVVAFCYWGGWLSCHRHRSLSLHGKVDRMTQSVGELVDEVRSDRDETRPPAPPSLSLVKGGRDGA